MEEPSTVQGVQSTISNPGRSTCSSCGTTLLSVSNQAFVTLVGEVTMSFPSLSVEKEFAQLLQKKDFKGFTDRQTLYGVLSKPENRYLARKMCGLLTVYGTGSSPTYVLMPETESDLELLVDTLKRPAGANELDVVKGRITGIAPPALCNAQELPVVSYCQLYSFAIEKFVKEVPRPEKVSAKDFEPVVNETFHRITRIAANGIGPTRALTFSALGYGGLYKLIAEKNADNWSLSDIGVLQSKSNPDHTDIALKFVRRDTGFAETYRFTVNSGGPFEFLEEPLHLSYEIS